MPYGLKDEIVRQITEVLARHREIEEVLIYGSRAKGTFKPGSDIDLTCKGKGLDLKILNRISIELDDLLLPYTFDLSIYDHISNPDLLDHIARVGRLFYRRPF